MSLTPRALLAAAALFAGSQANPSIGLAAKVLVLPYQPLGKGVPTDLAEQATQVITKEMAQGGLTVIRADDVAEAPPAAPKPAGAPRAQDAPTGDASAGKKAEELIHRAKSAVEESEFATAIKELRNAVRLLEENGDAVPDLRMLPEAYLQLGVACFQNGNEDEGDDMLNKVVHLAPDRTLDPAEYPPLFIRVFDRARFNVLRRPRATIEVRAAKGAQVLFDGRNLGKAPVILKEALPGNHWIRVERPGEAMLVKKVSVKSGKAMVVEFEGAEAAPPDPGAQAGVLGAVGQNELTRADIAQLKSAGSRAGADFVMFGAIYKSETAYNIRTAFVAVKTGEVGRLLDVAFDLDMLSAEIEVYKLAEDARNQALSGRLTRIAEGDKLAIAPGFKGKAGGDRKSTKTGEKETKVAMVLAAPPAPAAPEVPVISDAPATGVAAATVDAKAASRGRAPVGNKENKESKDAGAAAKPEVGGVVVAAKPAVSVTPKDEIPSSRSIEAAPRSTSAATGATLILPKDEKRGDDGPSTWWIWALVGVAALGAAGAGGYFLLNGRSPTEGNLKVTWQ